MNKESIKERKQFGGLETVINTPWEQGGATARPVPGEQKCCRTRQYVSLNSKSRMGIGTYFWTFINHAIAIFLKHPDPPTKLTQEATEEEKLNDGVTEVAKVTEEATTADFLPNNTQHVTTHHDNVLNRAVSLKEASFLSQSDVSPNNENGDNITNSSYEDSFRYQERSSDTEISLKRTDENDRKNDLTSDKYCLKDRIDWFKDKVQGDYANTCAIHCIYVAVKISQGVSWEDIYKEYWCLCWDQKKDRCSCCNEKDEKVILYLVNTKILLRRTDESPKGICNYYKKNGLIRLELDTTIKRCSVTYKNFYFGKLLNKTDIGKIDDSPQAIYFVYHGQSSMLHLTLLINLIKGNRLLYFNPLGGCDELSTYCSCDNCLEDTLHKKKTVKKNPGKKFEIQRCRRQNSSLIGTIPI